MAKHVKQFRYYSEKSEKATKNYPTNLSTRQLVSGSAFSDFMPIIQLGIQGLPGTKFFLNNANNPVIIGNTGIYELELEGMSEIIALTFEKKSIDMIDRNPNAYLIVDIIYEDGEG